MNTETLVVPKGDPKTDAPQPDVLHSIAKRFVEAKRSGETSAEISGEIGVLIRSVLESSEDPATTGNEITRRIRLLINPVEQRQGLNGIANAASTSVGGIGRDVIEKRQREKARIEFEQRRPNRPSRDALIRESNSWPVGGNPPKKEEKAVYELLLEENSDPMNAETAIRLMVGRLELEDKALILERFPDLKGFDGQIYFGCKMPGKGHNINLQICGVKDGKTVFFLECEYYENGWWPTKRNDTHVNYNPATDK